ncbi:MAG: ABC transporter permease [Candidatus Bathyarchaeota archaeon]|nr:ABC transporter permease [Candidatus Bathyarchaeota archaeon]
MASLFSKQRREIWSRRIKSFWQEYRNNKIGLVGLLIVFIYAFVAIFAPWLTPYDPLNPEAVAQGFAMPEWVTIIPEYRYLPRTLDMPLDWTIKDKSEFINATTGSNGFTASYNGTGTQSINLTTTFLYPFDPPKKFRLGFTWTISNMTDAEYSAELYMSNPAGNTFIFYASYQNLPTAPFSTVPKHNLGTTLYSTSLPLYMYERLGVDKGTNVAQMIFLEQGEYKVQFHIRFRSTAETGAMEMQITNSKLMIFGLVHGLLGTDSIGRDIVSQLVYGTRISLAVGLFAAVISTSLGIFIGIVAGYFGGLVDETLMRIVDILLCLPVLPLLLGLMVIYGTSVWYLVILIAIFGWQGLSRIIRSRVLSLKEMPFVECARAAGGSKFYIMLKHMVPNVLPVALASMILSVPAAILTEAAISFIGLGDPSAPTWGRMLHYANSRGGFFALAWWWIIPPGLAITILTLCFVFIGHAVDEIVNPRLRRRR